MKTYSTLATSNKIIITCERCGLGDAKFKKYKNYFSVECLNCHKKFNCRKLETATNGITFYVR